MKVSILCSDSRHPVYPLLNAWRVLRSGSHEVDLVEKATELKGGDILFLISCHELVTREQRARYSVSLVIHSSNPPEGRGWSPQVWEIVEGRNALTVTLLEARDEVDSGPIWTQRQIEFEGHELYDEINSSLFSVWLALMDFGIDNFGSIVPKPQDCRPATFYRRRTPDDSRLDPYKTIADQFDLLRVADWKRYPAFFDYCGFRYVVRIEKREKLTSGAGDRLMTRASGEHPGSD